MVDRLCDLMRSKALLTPVSLNISQQPEFAGSKKVDEVPSTGPRYGVSYVCQGRGVLVGLVGVSASSNRI